MDPLLPVRHPNKDFFVCDIFDSLPGFRDDRASMEHPIFSLSTKPDMRELEYEHNGNTLKIIPSGMGLATIHDKDVLLYAASYLRAALKEGLEIKKTIRITSHDVLVTTNRPTNNLGYDRLENALRRLRGTTLETNIRTNGMKITKGFGLINEWEAVRRDEGEGRLLSLEIELSDWFFNAVLADELLSINSRYFRLRKPLERRLYEIGRKHCGEQDEWSIGLEKLKKKSGSTSPEKKFRFMLNEIIKTDRKQKHFPDYGLYLNDNVLVFKNRRKKSQSTIPAFEPWVFEKAKAAAPGYDVYALESEWRLWAAEKEKPEKGYPAAFIGFCKQKPPL